MIQINEIFGPTVQGEGAAAGRHCLFIRVAECNLRCKWCDTAYTWAFSEPRAENLELPIRKVYDKAENLKLMSSDDVLHELRKLWPVVSSPTMIVISGGEPLMQHRDLIPVVRQLSDWGNTIHVETAGTLLPGDAFNSYVNQYNVSPKLIHSGNDMRKAFKPEVLSFFARDPRAWFKYVIRSVEDLGEVAAQCIEIGADRNRVMVMPEGVTLDQNLKVAREIVDEAVRMGFGLSLREHIALWKDVRGK